MTDRPALDPAVLGAIQRVELRGRATMEDIQAAASAATRPLPEDYLAFLRTSDGAEGWIGENYVQIATARGAADTTKAFAEFVPGLFFFASDGAEGLFAFDLRDEARRVVITHTDDMDFSGLVYAADSFTRFLRFLEHQGWSRYWYEQRTAGRSHT